MDVGNRVSDSFLGPRFRFMKFRKKSLKNTQKVSRFFQIK